MDLIENNISFLAGYLEGISKVDGQIRERLLSAFTIPYDSTISIDNNFFNFFDDWKELVFSYESIGFFDIEETVRSYLLKNPFGLNLDVDVSERKQYLAYVMMDHLQYCFPENTAFKSLDVFYSTLTFENGVINKYILIPFGDQALTILINEGYVPDTDT